MDVAVVREEFDREMRRGAGEAAPEGVVRVVEGKGAHAWAAVVWSGFAEGEGDAADRAVAAQRDWLASAEVDEFEWKLYSYDRPADLAQRLTAAGFTAQPPETLMVADVAELTALPGTGAPPPGVRLEAVTDAPGVELLARAHEEAFGTSADRLRRQLLEQLADPRVEMTVALADGRPVSGARMEFHPGTGFASLWGGGTVQEWRGRGVYRSLVGHRARLAAARGCRHLQVDASDRSRPILARLGFAALAVTTPYVLTAADVGR